MKFSCNVTELLKIIQPIINIAEKSISKDFPDLNKISIEVRQECLVLTAFNGIIGIKAFVNNTIYSSLGYEFFDTGEALINSKSFINVLNSFDGHSVYIELKKIDNSKELIVYPEDDKDQFQTIPCYDTMLNYPASANNVSKEITVDNSSFINSLKKINFAVGFEKSNKVEYLYIAMKVHNKNLRFVSGHGARFAIIDLKGDDLFKSSSNCEFLFHKDTITPIINSLSSCITDKVVIKEYNSKSEIPQITISANPYDIVLVGIDPQIKYADENKVMSLETDIKFTVKVSDIKNASYGINATISEDRRKLGGIFPTELNMDFSNKIISIKSTDVMKALRKVKILDCVTNNISNINVSIPAVYLSEISDHAKDCEYMQIEMFSDSNKPIIIVSYYASEKVSNKDTLIRFMNTSKVSEKMTMFFSMLRNKNE